jgi:16S rRNA (guanine966-N2)-methyltransferase
MTRIVGGDLGGRRLEVPRGRDTRPTSERAREGLFSSLEAMRGSLRGASVADLFAGSGAVGLEAASRGAARVLLVERDPKAVAVCRRNVAALGLDGVEVRDDTVDRVLAQAPDASYDVIYVDPPYAEPVDGVLQAVVDQGWLAAGGVVVVERDSRGDPPPWPVGIDEDRSRRYGDSTLWYGRQP